MKKWIALLLTLALALSLCACGAKTEEPAAEESETAAAEESSQTEATPEDAPPVMVIGTLSMLNMTEEEYAAYQAARRQVGSQLIGEDYAALQEGVPEQLPKDIETHIVFYDTLDALLMALNAGDIAGIELYQSVARYLCANNDNIKMLISYDAAKERNTFADLVQDGPNGNDFAFLMMEDNAALRDEFNAAIAEMKADGTLDRLVQEQIDDLVNGGEIKPIELPKLDGAETIKVAVTGALPPMDYVAPDGSPAGFNTAVLAEIADRLGVNIELVVVDSIGRAAALASGAVDAVFWTRTSSLGQKLAAMTEEERQAYRAEMDANMTEEEAALLHEMVESANLTVYSGADMPEGTITTEPYFSDVFVMINLAR